MVIVLALNFAFDFFYFYEFVSELDSAVHFFGGLVTAVTVARLALWSEGRGYLPHIHGWARVVLGVAVVACVAMLWEVYEFGVSAVFPVTMQPGLADTIVDMIMGSCGGASYFVFNLVCDRRRATATASAPMQMPVFVDVPIDLTPTLSFEERERVR